MTVAAVINAESVMGRLKIQIKDRIHERSENWGLSHDMLIAKLMSDTQYDLNTEAVANSLVSTQVLPSCACV